MRNSFHRFLTEFYKEGSGFTDSNGTQTAHRLCHYISVPSNLYELFVFKVAFNMSAIFSPWLPPHTHILFLVKGKEEYVV